MDFYIKHFNGERRMGMSDDHYIQDFSKPWEIQPDDPKINDLDSDEDSEGTDTL